LVALQLPPPQQQRACCELPRPGLFNKWLLGSILNALLFRLKKVVKKTATAL
jgi:hypothetical protein